MSTDETPLQWLDALTIGVEGKGWADTHAPYDRLPRKAQALVPPAVWDLSHSSTGMCVRFRTNASQIHTRWQLQHAMLEEPNFNRCSFSGLDLYGRDGTTWRWASTTQSFEGQTPQVCIAQGLDGVERDYLLYLPSRNALLKLEIGVPTISNLTALPPRTDKPLVFYGTSIVHGAYASHGGLVYPSILGRRLNRPIVNLGFSGSARMERSMADLIAELDAQAYILDPLPNMDLNLVNERAESFIRRLRELRPRTPMVLVEDFPRTNAWIMPWKQVEDAKCRRYRELYRQLVDSGMTGLYYVEGQELFGTDNEASIDGIHPGDLGYMRMADLIEPVLRDAITAQA